MGDKTSIEWTRGDDGTPGATWNPTTGCDQVSPGCDHCYALTMAKRLKGMGSKDYQNDGDPKTSGPGFAATVHPHRFDVPLRWRRPRRIFVNSMSDLFHEAVSNEFIAQVFAAMALAPQHTFQVLTKRHGRMRSLLSRENFRDALVEYILLRDEPVGHLEPLELREHWWPLPNVWLGVSVEDQKWADIRIPALLDTPAAVRFISAEPLLGPVSLSKWLCRCGLDKDPIPGVRHIDACPKRPAIEPTARIGWVIVGGESGPGARPMHPNWARNIRDQCTVAGVAFHFKQWGEWAPATVGPVAGDRWISGDGVLRQDWASGSAGAEPGRWDAFGDALVRRVGKKAAGRELDGCTWDQYPEPVTA